MARTRTILQKKTLAGTKKPPKQKSIQPILFLSRELTDPEKKYWSSELEVAGLVWVVKKLRHMIETAELPVIVYTDHAAAVGISKQSSLNTTSIEKLNLKLVRSSEYLQRFRLEVRHRPGVTNVIPDALSRLPIVKDTKEYLLERDYNLYSEEGRAVEEAEEAVSAYPVTMVEMSEEFKERVKEGYKVDPRCIRLRAMIEENAGLRENAADIPYKLVRGLIYFKDPEQGMRLCIPQPLVHTVFNMIHDELGHPGYSRSHERLTEGVYIFNMAKQLHEYIRHCVQCQLHQTPRHRPYGALQPILVPPRPFHTITIDFILALPETKEGYDCVLSVTDKFSKAITLIPGKSTWGGKDWSIQLLDRLSLLTWGLPRAILSDRDRKFVSELWKAIFKRLKVELLFSTSYHPQTDGQSERTNQTVEIALRFYLASLENPGEWPTVLPRLSQALCNSTNFSSTGKTPTQMLYGFRIRETVDFLRMEEEQHPVVMEESEGTPEPSTQAYPAETRERLPLAAMDGYRATHVDAKDAIAFASSRMKESYDKQHKPMFFKIGDKVKLRLHRGYKVPAIPNRKLGQQFVGPFTVTGRIGRLAYRLDLPTTWRVHPVISVAQLEPWPNENDPFGRPQPNTQPTVIVQGQEEYEIERLLRKRTIRRGRRYSTEYLVRWVGWGPEHDSWFNVKDLGNARDLVEEFDREEERAAEGALP